MTRFAGRGEEEARLTEIHNVQTAMVGMMFDNELRRISAPVTIPTNDMSAFPDATSPHGLRGVGYRLFGHDIDGDGTGETNYLTLKTTLWTYTTNEFGQLTQHGKAAVSP